MNGRFLDVWVSDGTYLELYAECSIDAGPRLYKGDRAHVRKLTQGNQRG